MLRDLNFCPSEPPELLELHEFSISPTLRASCSFPQQKKYTPETEKMEPKNHCQLNFGTSSSKLFFCGFHVSAQGELGPRWWFGILESPPNDSEDSKSLGVFPASNPKTTFCPKPTKSTNLVDFQLLKNPWVFPIWLPDVFQKVEDLTFPRVERAHTTVFLHFLGSMASRQSCVRPKPPVVWAPWICSGALEGFGWMVGDGGRFWRVLEGVGFSPRRMKT